MKKTILSISILITSLSFAETYLYSYDINDPDVFNTQHNSESTSILNDRELISSDSGVDWYGELPSSEFITGDALATLTGITSGNSHNSNIGWLHVVLDGKELFIAKRTIRYNISWNQLNEADLISGNTIVEILGNNYKVRLMECANTNPMPNVTGFDIPQTHGSEWNRIFYRLTNNVYRDENNTKSSEGNFTQLANYSEGDLLLWWQNGWPSGSYTTFNGNRTWCQETSQDERVVYRGRLGVSRIDTTSPTFSSYTYGWRPVLEKVN